MTENNLRYLTILRICKWFMLYMPVLILFYQSNGLTLEAALGVQAVYSLMIAVCEVPSGYISDRWGRKPSLVLGMGLLTLQFIVLSVSSDFVGFAIGVAVGGVGASFISGTDSALLYETLKASGRVDEYLRREGRLYAIGNVSEALAAIIGGWLAWWLSLRVPIILQGIFSAVGLWAALRLWEPEREAVGQRSGNPLSDIRRILRGVLWENPTLLFWLCLSAVVGSASHLLAWTAQPYLKDSWQWEPWAIGLAWSALNLSVAMVSWSAYRWYGNRRAERVAWTLWGCLVGGYAGLAVAWWGGSAVAFVFLAFTFGVRGVAAPFFKDVVNQHTPADARATVFSIREFMVRMLYVLIAPWMGYMSDVYSMEVAFMLEVLLLVGVGAGVGGLREAYGGRRR